MNEEFDDIEGTPEPIVTHRPAPKPEPRKSAPAPAPKPVSAPAPAPVVVAPIPSVSVVPDLMVASPVDDTIQVLYQQLDKIDALAKVSEERIKAEHEKLKGYKKTAASIKRTLASLEGEKDEA